MMSLVPVETLPPTPARPVDGHKGTFGRVLLIAGSRGMTGAAILSGLGALRGGAGLVYVAAPESVVPVIAAAEPSYLTIPLPEDGQGRLLEATLDLLRARCAEMTAVGIGPGLGQSTDCGEVVAALYRELQVPLVCDADALNLLSLRGGFVAQPPGPRILTPHPGEFARMARQAWKEIEPHRASTAGAFAKAHAAVVVLKGPGTIVTDGNRRYLNNTGNCGMATGGTGDVLTGLICALIAQGMEAFEAAQLGVWLHGRAGDLAAAELSQPGLIASDLPSFLCAAWKELGN